MVKKTFSCSVCLRSRYCSVECQKKEWPKHKKECEPAEEQARGIQSVRREMTSPDFGEICLKFANYMRVKFNVPFVECNVFTIKDQQNKPVHFWILKGVPLDRPDPPHTRKDEERCILYHKDSLTGNGEPFGCLRHPKLENNDELEYFYSSMSERRIVVVKRVEDAYVMVDAQDTKKELWLHKIKNWF